jgi:IS30 family transposase
MDFIKQLPVSSRHTAILIIVDHLSKQCVFIPTDNKVTSLELAKLFTPCLLKHGVPLHITSDRGVEFVFHFFHSLGKALNIQLHFTSGYHPKGDGQTE